MAGAAPEPGFRRSVRWRLIAQPRALVEPKELTGGDHIAIDVARIIQAAIQAAQEPSPSPPPKKSRRLPVGRAALAGAGLVTAGRLLASPKAREMIDSLQKRVADLDGESDEQPEPEYYDESEEDFDDDFEEEEEPEDEYEDDFEEEDEEEEEEEPPSPPRRRSRSKTRSGS